MFQNVAYRPTVYRTGLLTITINFYFLGAHVTWLRDGAKVSAAKMETKAEGDSHSLVIKNATIEDVGEYICQAENVTSKTELEVQSKEEKIEVENHIMQQMGIKGENIFFQGQQRLTPKAHMGQFLQDGENVCLTSFFFKSRRVVWLNQTILTTSVDLW